MILIDDEGKQFKLLPFSNIKEGDMYLREDTSIAIALLDYPEEFASFILERVDALDFEWKDSYL